MSFEEGRLSLAYRNLDELPKDIVNKYRNDVEILDVSCNKIVDVKFLAWFPKLTSAILDGNKISGSTVFPPVDSLNLLWLNNNKIQCLFPLVENLTNNYPNLKQLSLMGNLVVPACNEETYYEYLRYRYYVISWFPNLEFLDDRLVTDFEKEEAAKLFDRPMFDSLSVSKFVSNSIDSIRAMFTPSQQQPRAHFI